MVIGKCESKDAIIDRPVSSYLTANTRNIEDSMGIFSLLLNFCWMDEVCDILG